MDALGSAYYLSTIFGDSEIASDGMDRFASYLSKKYNIEVLSDVDPSAYSEIIAVDTASREQLGKFRDVRLDAIYDHHASNDILAERRIVKDSYPSCSEMLYDMYGMVEDNIAHLLLAGGIISDTDWFRHANTRTFRIFSRILEDAKMEFSDISSIFEFPYNQSEKIAILKGMQRMKFRTKGSKIICATVVGAHESSFAMLMSSLVDVVFVGSQRKDTVRVTSRSKELNLLDVLGEVATDFDCSYGGHKNAAGMQCTGDVEAILNALVKSAEKKL